MDLVNNKKNTKNDFVSYKDLIMYFQTSIRNVALTTAVAFAALGYSRFYRGASKLYSVGLGFVSLLILICSFLLNYFLYLSLQKYVNLEDYKEINNWVMINQIFMVVHALVLFFGAYTVIRLFTGNKFK